MIGENIDPVLASVTAPIRDFLDDPCIVEIMLNDNGSVWVETAGQKMVDTGKTMTAAQATSLLSIVASDNDKLLSRHCPSIGGTLMHWKSRVQGLIPPIVENPVFAIRQPARTVYTLEQCVSAGVLSEEERLALQGAVVAKQNIVVGGGTGSGKTTLLNALLQVVAEHTDHRVYIVEDRRELQCLVPNRVRAMTIPGRYDLREGVFDSLSMRPDRIVVGELRDGSAHELISAWNTGHSGGLASVHANGTTEMLTRICRLSAQVVANVSREEIAETINVCVHMERTASGRRVTGIVRVDGYDDERRRWMTSPLVKQKRCLGKINGNSHSLDGMGGERAISNSNKEQLNEYF